MALVHQASGLEKPWNVLQPIEDLDDTKSGDHRCNSQWPNLPVIFHFNLRPASKFSHLITGPFRGSAKPISYKDHDNKSGMQTFQKRGSQASFLGSLSKWAKESRKLDLLTRRSVPGHFFHTSSSYDAVFSFKIAIRYPHILPVVVK